MDSRNRRLLSSSELRPWLQVEAPRSLFALAVDYLCLLALHGSALFLLHQRPDGPLGLLVAIAILPFTIFLTGCLIHRIGLLGHEASHYLLHPNRRWNDLLGELFCFFPLWSSMSAYRAKHAGHHRHPNDPDQDPNLAGPKAEEVYARFPMPRKSFIWTYYVKFFWPPFVLRNLFDLFRALSAGRSARRESATEPGSSSWPTFLGVVHLVVLVAANRIGISRGDPLFLAGLQGGVIFLSTAIWFLLPRSLFADGRRAGAIDPKTIALLRLFFFSGVSLGICWTRFLTGLDAFLYYFVFWVVPLAYVFPYLMLLREVYQHANLGTGTLDNSRLIRSDPFTRWALLGYGNDLHNIHHIYPNIPFYHLRAAHEALLEHSTAYRESLVETRGIFRSKAGESSLLASLESSPDETVAEPASPPEPSS